MENKIGLVTNFKIGSIDERGRSTDDAYVTFLTEASVNVGQMVDVLNAKGTGHYKITSIEIREDVLSVTAKEVGYWARQVNRLENFDIRSMIGLEVVLVTDEKALAAIHEESCWC